MKDRIPVVLIKFLSLLPLSWSRCLGWLLGELFWLFPNSLTDTTRKNIRFCFPSMTPSARRRLARQSLKEMGKTLCEMGVMWHWPVEKTLARVTDVHGLELYKAAIDRGKGVIIVAPHLGNWELLGHYLPLFHPTTNMYLPPENPQLDQLMQAARTRGGSQLVPTNKRGVMALLKCLKRGEVIGVLPDQVPEFGSGVFAPFFGRPALTMTLLGNLAKKTDCTVLCAYTERVPKGFVIHFQEALPDIANDDTTVAATALNQSVENLVRENLAQYQWEYKRFKRQPDGATKFYNDLSR